MNEWKEYKLGDLISTNQNTINSKYSHDEIQYLDTGSITRGKIDSYQQLNIKEAPSRAKRLIKHNDIVYSTVRPIQRHYGIIKNPSEKIIVSTGFVVISCNENYLSPDFLYHLLSSDENVEYLDSIAEGSTSTYPSLKPSDIESLIFNLPPLPEQKAIASILSSLDDKIDLLHRQNTTLEKMAETLFRQWFVEEAKEDWELGKLSDLVVVKYGKDHKKLLDGKIPVFGSGGIMRFADKYLYDKESVLIPRKGSLNNVMYQDEPFWTVDTMFYTEMKVDNVAKYVYQFLKQQDLASMNVGSAVPSMTTEILNNMPIEIPNSEILHRFELNVSLYYKKIKSNQIQIRTLTSMRDTLLPKLMSGEVRVKM